MDIRNIAIIAHVDHGKTTLTDALMRQTGAVEEGVSMDSNSIELERGITIYSKNTSIIYKDTKINIVDTPGHADFGSEVERVLRSIDSVLLVVDAQEGPMPQTRFVLKKSLELGLKPIVVINKIDKPAADVAKCEEGVLELFLELGANDEQVEFPVVYSIGREGVAKKNMSDPLVDLSPLLDVVLNHVPVASGAPADAPLSLQSFNLAYDNYLGRMAICRVYQGTVTAGQNVFVKTPEGETRAGKLTKIFTFEGIARNEQDEVTPGDIVLVAGLPNIDIGETITDDAATPSLPGISIDEPTITLNFLPNNSPFGGREGKFVTSRQIRERLERELEVNVGLKVSFDDADKFKVSGRGELHIAVLLENMRREGYEMAVSQPEVIMREENGKTLEPFEEVVVDIPLDVQGVVMERLGARAFIATNMIAHEENIRIIFEGPTRGLLGYRNQFVVDTKGEGILSARVVGFRPFAGVIKKKQTGSMISMATGKALAFALWNLQERGVLYIGAQTEVYEGMVLGSTSKGEEMPVNPTKGKQLTNMRSKGTDEAVTLVPPYLLTIERGLEIMAKDEYLEVTPESVRLRKQLLTESERSRAKRSYTISN
ncbi:MAG: translational GTPase TypA [bacterium]|nr:translational GTPase TypA [bacterium]